MYVIATLAAIYISPLTSAVLFLVVTVLSQLEFLRTFKGRAKPHISLSVISGVLIYSGLALHGLDYISYQKLVLLFAPVVVVFIYELYRNKENPFLNIGATVMSITYIVVPIAFLNYTYFYGSLFPGPSYQFILAFFAFIWLNDTLAYAVGLLLGRNKLFPRISPKKTWEGLFGGMLFTLLAGWGCSLIFNSLSLFEWLGFALIVSVFSTFGDLIESMLKRDFEVKDSGSILPGHGGMLDRFDGVLLASPAVFLYLNLIL